MQLQLPAHQPTKYRRRGQIHLSQLQAFERDSDGIADHVGGKPDEDLECGGADNGGEHGGFFTEKVHWVRKEEAAEGDAGPESQSHVADAGLGAQVGDEKRDESA